jgi:multiple sugar transport system substrate-binding protein
MKMRIFAGILAGFLCLSCGNKQSQPIKIVWWQFWTDAAIRPTIQEIVHDFETRHPGVMVDLVDLTWADGHDKISIAFSSGTGPDVVELGSDWIPEYSSTGHLLDLTASIDSIKADYMMWEPGSYEGKTYAFPWILGTRVLFINPALVSRAGYPSEFVPGNWTELLEAAGRINDLGGDAFGFGCNAAERHRLYKKFLPFLWANGGDILSPDGKTCLLDSPQAVAALEYYLKLCHTGLTDTQRRLEDAFLEGKIGFIISGDWLLKRLAAEKPDMPFTTAIIPGPDGPSSSASFAGGEYLAVNAKSGHPQLALELIKHMCSPENQLRFCLRNQSANPSSRKTAADSTLLRQPHFDTFIRQLALSRIPPVHPEWVYVEDKLEKGIEAALYGVKTPRQAFADAAREIKELLDQ